MDATVKMEEIKPPTLSRFTDDQTDHLCKVLKSGAPTTMTTAPEPTPSTLMEVTELQRSHIHEMYEQSFHATEEDMDPMFMDNLDEEQTPVKTIPSADKMEAR